jgi:hypothetical protein
MECKIKGKWLELDYKESERACGVKVENKFVVNSVTVSHKRVKLLIADYKPEELKRFGGKFLYHHADVIFLNFRNIERKEYLSLFFQVAIEPWLNRVFSDLLYYGKLQRGGKKGIKKKKEEIRRQILDGLISLYKEKGKVEEAFILINLFINTGDIFYFLVEATEEVKKDLPWFFTFGERKLTKVEPEVCIEIVNFSLSLADFTYKAYNLE